MSVFVSLGAVVLVVLLGGNLGGLGLSLIMAVVLFSTLSGFSGFGWEVWYVLAMVNVGGILVLMVYTSSTDEMSAATPLWGQMVGIMVAVVLMFGLTGVGWDLLKENMVYSSGVGWVVVMSGVFLIGVMALCNSILSKGLGALRV